MAAPNTTNNVTVRKLADVAEGMWNKSKNAFVNASGDTMTGRLTMENVPINQIVTGTGTAATSSSSGGTTTYYPAKWNFDLGIATPSAGDQLVIKIPVAGHDYGTFMSTDNGTTYYPVAQSTGSTRFTTRYPVNAYVFIVFEEYTGSGNSGQVNDCYAVAGSTGRSAYKVGCWRVVNDYDSGNNYDRLYTANGRFRTGSTGCYPYSLVCLDNTQGYSTLVTSNPGTGTNKNINTDGKFVFPASILYYAGNNTTAAGALVSSTYSTFLALPSVDVRYSSNHTTTFTTHKPVYIECTLNGDGTWSPTSNSITQTLRTSYYYIYLGIAYSTEYQVSLAPEHPLYYYDGTNLVSAEVARGDITSGTNNGELNVAGTDITVYTHPTDAGNKHIPAGGSSGQFLGYDSDGTAKWVSNPNTDTKVKATAKTDNVNYKILATASASPTSGAATEAVYDTDITLNPSTNTISANVSGTAASAGKLTTARTTYVTLGTASTSTTRDWSGTTTIPVSGTLGLGNGGTGATSAAGARTNLDVYSKSETESLLNGKVVIVTVLPATGEAGKTYYVKDTSATGVDKYDEYIWAVDAGATTESWIHVGEKSLDLSEYVNSLTTSGTGPLVKSLSKSGNTLTATLGTIAIDNLSDWASSTDVTVSSVTYHTWWPVAPTSSNQVYGLSIYNGRLYRVYNNKGTYSVQNYDANTTYTNKALGQGYGTCATEAATAAKIVTMSDYVLTTGGIVTVKFTNALCASATMNINGKGAKPIYIKGAAVTANNAATVSAGDTAYFMYDGTAYHLLGTDRAATNPIVNISRSGTTFTATRLDGTTFTFTQQDNNTTYTQAKLGQGYGTCTTAEATAAKSVTLTGYELEPNGVVAVKFTNGLCASATMSINGKTATPIYINGAAVTSTSCKEVLAGDLAFFIYDGSHYQFICTDRISKNGITGLSISGKTITYTRADGSTGTLTTQDTTYTFDGVYNSSSNKAATVSTVTNAVNALDVDDITGFGAGKTLKTLTETDGKIAATFQDISITKSQVSDFSHSHGNITNDGQIQSASDTAIAADDKIIVADKSNGNKLVRSSVTFDGSTTTTALTPKGTWEAFAKASDISTAIEALDEGVVHLANKETLTGEKVLGAGYRIANASNENAGYTIFTLPGNNYGTKYTNWDSALKDGAHFREWRFCFPTGCNFWGKVRFTIYGRYSNFNASGVLSKTINVAFNTSSCYLNVGAYDALGYNIEKEFRISDLVWNSTESRWEVILHSIKPSSDNTTVLVIVEAWASTTSASSVTDGIAVARQITWVSGTPTIVTDTTYHNTWRNMTFNWADQPVLQSPYGNKIFDAADVIPIANGGTSATSATGAEYNILSKARTDLSANAILETYRIPFLTTSPSTSNGVIAGYRTALAVWNYMKGNMSSDSNVNISGNAATASAAQTGSALETAIDSKANIANSVYYGVGSHSYASWAANTTYAANDNVVYSNRVYYCKTAHTSTSSFDSSKWTYLATVTLKGTADGITTISTGLKIAYKMPAIYGGNTSTYLNINNLGSYYIKRNNGNMSTHIPPNAAAFFVFDGTAWQWADYDSNTNNWVTTMGAYCDTAAATAAKVATSTNTVLTAGMSFLIRIVNSNTSAGKLTLNINSTGAKDVWINGAVSSASNYTLPAGEHWCHYDGSVFHIWTDGTVQFKQLKLTNKLSDDNIDSAATWNAKQDALSTQTAYSAKGTATKVPQITTNSLGQVTGITEVTISGVTPASHSHGNIANGGTLTDTAAVAAGNDYVVIRDADNAKIQTSTIKGTDVADAVSKKHSHSTLTLSTTAQAYDGSHTLALPSTDPYTSARTPASHTHGNIANGGTLTDTAAAAAGNDYVVIRDADNAKIQTSTIKGTDVADAVSKKHSHSTLTLSTTAQAYDGSHTLALPSTDPYTSARTPASHTHGNIANGGTLTDTAAAAAGNDYVVIRDADNAKIQTSTIKGTDVADAVSKKHSHSTLTLSKTAQTYDGTHTLALPADDPYTSARTPTEHQHEKLSYTNLADAVLPNNAESGVLRRFYSTGVPSYCSFIKMFDVTQFYDGTIVNKVNEQSTFIGDVSFIRCGGGTLVQKVKVVMGLAYASSWARLYGDSKFCHPVVIKDSINILSSWIVNNYIPIGDVGSTVSLTPTANNNLAYCVIDCSNYSTMYVNLYSVTGAPAWAFIDASNTILSRCSGITANATLDVPQGAVKLICNLKNTTEYKNNCYAAVDADDPRYYLALRTEGVTMSCYMVCEGRFYTRTTATATIAARPLLTDNIMVPNYGASSTSLPVGYTVQQDTSFTDVAGTIGTARELAVSLSNTSTTTKFDGSANVTNIKVSGTLPISNGGTGATTKKAAEFAINGGMSEATAAMQDNFQIVFSQVGSAQNATNGVFLYRQASTVWNYFKTKFSYMTQAEEDNLITELGDL